MSKPPTKSRQKNTRNHHDEQTTRCVLIYIHITNIYDAKLSCVGGQHTNLFRRVAPRSRLLDEETTLKAYLILVAGVARGGASRPASPVPIVIRHAARERLLLPELHRLHRGHRPGHGGPRLPPLDAEEAAAPAAGSSTTRRRLRRREIRIAAFGSRPPSAADTGAAALSGAAGRATAAVAAAAGSLGCDFLRDEQSGHRRAYRSELVAVDDSVGRLFV